MTQFFGKYRGTVKNNVDLRGLGRLQVEVPAVQGTNSNNWAYPCVPYAGRGVGFYFIPPQGANVWVEYEGGNPNLPIWSGCFWGEGETPAQPANAGMKVIKTDNATITISEPPNDPGFTIETLNPQVKITITVNGIEITNGMGAGLKMSGPQVSINDGALEVT